MRKMIIGVKTGFGKDLAKLTGLLQAFSSLEIAESHLECARNLVAIGQMSMLRKAPPRSKLLGCLEVEF